MGRLRINEQHPTVGRRDSRVAEEAMSLLFILAHLECFSFTSEGQRFLPSGGHSSALQGSAKICLDHRDLLVGRVDPGTGSQRS